MPTIDLSLFPPEKIIKITATNYFDAFSKLAQATKTDLDKLITHCHQLPNYQGLLRQAQESLHNTLKMRNNHNYFTPHLENYLESFCGYSIGGSISLDESALLQMEFYAGCQSLAIQKSSNQEIFGFHTEEDSSAYEIFGDAKFGKYWVEIELPNKKISFLHYVGLCGFGYSYTITPTLLNISDVIGSCLNGKIWSHIINFSLINCPSLNSIKELVSNLSQLPDPKFQEGYTTTIIELNPQPQMIQVEFGGNLIIINNPTTYPNYSFYSGTNYPNNQYLQSIDVANSEPTLPQAYLDRFNRLANSASEIINSPNEIFQAIQTSLKDPQGEWRNDWFTGYSNIYVANHILFHINQNGELTLKLIDGNPL